ncbi:MAG: FecR domain-containing protein [Acidobacteriota bacterium]|nr:MAG: FecR domain-containing protein [Acidobacteriota bacterium]
MNSHVTNQISLFLDRELSEDERREVGEHLITCAECRRAHDEEKAGRELARVMSGEDAPPSVWAGIESKLGQAEEEDRARRRRARILKPALAFGVAIIAMVLAAPFYIYLTSDEEQAAERPVEGPVWTIEETQGDPSTSGSGNTIAAGEVIETDASSSARIAVGDIGRVDVAPNSRVKIVSTSETEKRMSLERGRLKAEIVAPPRLFIVDTPSAKAVDLGCAYTLDVDENGNSRLHVTSGYVALETEGLESYVPAGAFCESRKGKKLGTPFFGNASDLLKKSLADFDFGDGGPNAIDTIIRESVRKDTLTLWHLLEKVPEAKRAEIVAKILEYLELPEGVTVDGLIRLDEKMMMDLRSDLEVLWYEEPGWFD